jgi:hypothetical protein
LKNRKREESAVKVFMAVAMFRVLVCVLKIEEAAVYISTSATYTGVLNHNLVLLVYLRRFSASLSHHSAVL